MSFAKQMKKSKESLFSYGESYLSDEEVMVVELPKKRIALVDLCDNDSDEKIHRKQRDRDPDAEIQVKPSRCNNSTAVYPIINLDTDDEEDRGSDCWEMESESEKSEDEQDSYDQSDRTWNGTDALFDCDFFEEVSEEDENLNNTDDETSVTRSRKKPRLQTNKKNSYNQEFGNELGAALSFRGSSRLSSSLSSPSSNCPQ
jgi:hypothetical protein